MKKTTTATRGNGSTAEGDPDFAPVVEAFAKDRRVTYRKMFASKGLRVDARIFAMLVKGKFVAKLPKERVDELVRRGEGKHFDPGHGRLTRSGFL